MAFMYIGGAAILTPLSTDDEKGGWTAFVVGADGDASKYLQFNQWRCAYCWVLGILFIIVSIG